MRTVKITLIPVIMFCLVLGCKNETKEPDNAKWKQEILDTERDFAAMAKAKGIPEAFLAYAADSAVLMRNNNLIMGKGKIAEYLKAQSITSTDMSLSWEPDFVDVSNSGDLGYTYGKFTFSMTDSTGVRQEGTGVFHTVWKRQQDGSWKFVWD